MSEVEIDVRDEFDVQDRIRCVRSKLDVRDRIECVIK